MKRFLLFFLFISTHFCHGQIQISNFQYPLDSSILNYKYYPKEENALLVSTQVGVQYLNLGTKELTDLKVNDSINVLHIESITKEHAIVTDSLRNYYVCSVNNDKLKLIHKIVGKDIPSTRVFYVHNSTSLIFFDEAILYQVNEENALPIDTLKNYFYGFGVENLIARDDNWAFQENGNLHYNNQKFKLWESPLSDYNFSLHFHKNKLLVYSSNGEMYELVNQNEKLTLNLLSVFKKTYGLTEKNDTLFAQSNGIEYFWADTVFTEIVNMKYVSYFQYKNDAFSISMYRMLGMYSFRIYSPDSSFYTGTVVQNTDGNSSTYQSTFIKSEKRKEKNYLFKINMFEREFMLLISPEGDSLKYKFFTEIKSLPNGNLLCLSSYKWIYNSNMSYGFNPNVLYELDTNNLEYSNFTSLAKNQKYLYQPSWLEYLSLGEKKLTVGSDFSKVLIDKKRESNDIVIIKSHNILNKKQYFLNDSITNIPFDSLYISYERFRSPSQNVLYLGMGGIKNEIKFFDLEKRQYFSIERDNVIFDELNYIEEIYAISPRNILFKTKNKIFQWDRTTSKLIYQDHNPYYSDTYIIDDPERKLIYLVKNIGEFSKLEIRLLSENSEFSEIYPKNKTPRFNYTSDLKTNGITLFIDDEILFLSKEHVYQIIKFWAGNILSYNFDENSNLWVSTHDVSGSYLYSSSNPNVKLAKSEFYLSFLPKSQYYLMEKKNITFIGTYNNQTSLLKYDFSKRTLSVSNLKPINWISQDINVSTLIVEAYNNKNELYFYLIDDSGSHILNKQQINSIDFKYADESIYVLGNLIGGTKQVFQLPFSDKEPIDLEWTIIEENLLPLAIKEEITKAMAYPNPFERELKLDITSLGYIDKSVFINSSGSVINSTSFNSLEESIEGNHQKAESWVSNVSSQILSGVYHLILFSNEEKIVKKIIKY